MKTQFVCTHCRDTGRESAPRKQGYGFELRACSQCRGLRPDGTLLGYNVAVPNQDNADNRIFEEPAPPTPLSGALVQPLEGALPAELPWPGFPNDPPAGFEDEPTETDAVPSEQAAPGQKTPEERHQALVEVATRLATKSPEGQQPAGTPHTSEPGSHHAAHSSSDSGSEAGAPGNASTPDDSPRDDEPPAVGRPGMGSPASDV